MLKKSLTLLSLSLIFNFLYGQNISSAPHSIKDIFHSNKSLWAVGESDQNGNGVYKYQYSKWYFYGGVNAKHITATNSDNPAIINNNNQLLILENNQWKNIASNVTCFSGSYTQNHIWAVISNELKFYKYNRWNNSSSNPMVIKNLSEARGGTLYAINSSDYLFKLTGSNWQIVNSLKGKIISASPNSTIYLSDDITNINQKNVKKYNIGNWTNYNITAKKVVTSLQEITYYIDGFGRLFKVSGSSSNQISGNAITNGSSNNSYDRNPHKVDSLTGETSLFKAIRNNDITAVFTILSQGSNINKKNNQLETPLIVATKMAKPEITKALIGLKPNLEAFDKKSKNALWYAVNNKDTVSIEALIEKGAKPNSLDFLGKIAKDKTSDKKKDNIIGQLVKAGVKVNASQITDLIKLNHEKNYFQLMNAKNKDLLTKTNFNSFLGEAVKVENKNIAKNCVENGADANPLAKLAIKKKDNELIIFSLKNGADTRSIIDYAVKNNETDLLWNCINNYGASKDYALVLSCKYKNFPYATELLKIGSNANSPMNDMILRKDTVFVKLLLSYKADGSNSNNFKTAVKTRSIEMVNLLLQNGAVHNDGILTAVETQSLEIVKLLLPHSDKTNIKLIEAASSRDNLEIIQFLVNMGSNAQNGLDIAIQSEKVKNVKILLENGAKINSDDLIVNAVKTKNIEMVQLLIESGANVNPGFKLAVEQNSAEIVDFLIKKGADTSNSNEYFTITVNKNYLSTLKVLINDGLNPNVIDNEKNTLLHLSCQKNLYEISSELINSEKIDINAINDDGLSALMYIVKVKRKRKDIKFCQLLVENGADVNARDGYGVIVRKMAKGRSTKKYLKKNGAFKK